MAEPDKIIKPMWDGIIRDSVLIKRMSIEEIKQLTNKRDGI